jgi:hypothetical protein
MAVAVPSSDYLTELMRLVERDHQRIESQDLRIAELERKLDDEIVRRRVLSSRVDWGEMTS